MCGITGLKARAGLPRKDDVVSRLLNKEDHVDPADCGEDFKRFSKFRTGSVIPIITRK